MGTSVVDGMEGSRHIEQSDSASFGLHHLAGPWRYVLRLCDLDEFGHDYSSVTRSSTESPDTPLHGHNSIRYCNLLRIFDRASSRALAETSTMPSAGLRWRTNQMPVGR